MDMREILISGFGEMEIPADETAIDRLLAYYRLLDEKNKVMNLTAIHGEEDSARLHFLDCGYLVKALPLKNASVLDIGSGAGFPGIVIKILEPTMKLTMLDSLQKRVTFQQEVVDALGLQQVRCIAGRAEEEKDLREKADVVTSRAVARLNLLGELCIPMVRKGGVFAAMKGPDPKEEIDEAAKGIHLLGASYQETKTYSIPGTDAAHSLVIIKKTGNTPPKYPRRFAQIKKQPL